MEKKNVLINGLQYIYKHFSIILNAKFITDICHTTGQMIMHMVHCGKYLAVLNKQMAQCLSAYSMQNAVASVITVLTSMDLVQKAHNYIYCTSVQFKSNNKY